MKVGIVGLPNVGKSTLFNAITNAGAQSANYPFCTIEPNIGVVAVPDERLTVLTKMFNSAKTVPTAIEFADIAGLVKGASAGEGLGNKFLANIREADAIIHVVRCFENDDIIHVEGSVDPLRDIEIINSELVLSDMEMLERRIDRLKKQAKADKKYLSEAEFLEECLAAMNEGKPARRLAQTPEEAEILAGSSLISNKPIIYAANMNENDFLENINKNPYYKQVSDYAVAEGAGVLPICAEFEAQLSGMDEDEKKAFLCEIGLSESGLDRLVRESYKLLGLISFLTAGPTESRAWTIVRGTKAPQAAGKIHSDFERGFIRAEVVAYTDLISSGGMTAAKEKGLVRSEGKEYVFQDGDVVLFRFNV